MKKVVFLALLGLILPLVASGPADASRAVTAQNNTPYTVKGNITYGTFLCRDDHPTIAPGTTFRVAIGACLTKIVNFSANGHDCDLHGGRPGNPTSFVIMTGAAVGYKTVYCVFTAR